MAIKCGIKPDLRIYQRLVSQTQTNSMLFVEHCDYLYDCVLSVVPVCVQSRTPALIFEYVNNTDFKVLSSFAVP